MKKNILKHESQIWAIADTLRSVGILDDNVRIAMMPFFALMMVDSRMVRATELLSEQKRKDGLTEEEIIEELKEDMPYYNSSIIERGISLKEICENDHNFNQNLNDYLESYDEETKLLLGVNPGDGELEYLNINSTIKKLKAKKVLFSISKQWSVIPFKDYNNSEITTLEEHIKRKWADISAGQFYTPSDIIDLIQKIISKHYEINQKEGYIKIYDPTCGGGNMVFGIEDNLRRINSKIKIQSFGQEIDDELYALAKIESRFREEAKIKWGNTLTTDEFEDEQFDYIAANPPYGYSWKDHSKEVKERGEHQKCYLDKYPSESDGQLLFLQHIIHKLKQDGYGVVVSNGSPLFSGDAGSGESDIRKWILDNNYLDALIQLPKEEFYNTKISTYLWIINKNRTEKDTKIKMIDSSSLFKKLSKSKGDKSVEMIEEQQIQVVDMLFSNVSSVEENDMIKVFDREYFYFNKQSVELKYKDTNGKSIEDILPMKKVKGEEVKSKSILIKDIVSISSIDKTKSIELDKEGNIVSILDFEEINNETLKEKSKRLQEYVKSIENEDLIIKDVTNIYSHNKKEETIEKTLIIGGDDKLIESLGNGVFKISISYKKATKTQKERIDIKVELLPKTEKDYEVIPFQEIKQGKIVDNNIDNYLNQWVEKDYEKLDNVVGVEINFNKIFYKYEKLRNVNEIFNDIKDNEKLLSELDNDIFDLSPIELSEEELKSLED